MLNEKQISVLTIKDISYPGLDKFFEDLNKKSDVKFGYLSATPVPSSDNKKRMKRGLYDDSREDDEDDGKLTMRIVMYAIDNKQVPVSTDKLKE